MRQFEEFEKSVKISLHESEMQKRTALVSQKQLSSIELAFKQFENLELARNRAAYLKWKVNENLDKYLIDFESALVRKGGKILWADDAATALKEIEQILKRKNAKKIIKSKSLIAEEIELNKFLKSKSYQIIESDIGDYIVDQFGEKSFHPQISAMHKSVGEVNEMLNKKISSSLDIQIDELNMDLRMNLRDNFFLADVGISEANFLIAESGNVCITENEGNASLCSTFAKTHIVIAGIDSILPLLNDIDLFFPLLATYQSGQKIATYNSIIGPKTTDEDDGPDEFIVVLIDNGRSNILAAQDQRIALSCIQCGACHHVCPVFKNIGGPAYNTAHTGPIGKVTEPLAKGLKDFQHLSFASTNCGKCKDICPVKIDIPNHLNQNRRDAIQLGLGNTGDKLTWFAWKQAMSSRKNLNSSEKFKNFTFKKLLKSTWGDEREFPKVVVKSFNQLWREKFGEQKPDKQVPFTNKSFKTY